MVSPCDSEVGLSLETVHDTLYTESQGCGESVFSYPRGTVKRAVTNSERGVPKITGIGVDGEIRRHTPVLLERIETILR